MNGTFGLLAVPWSVWVAFAVPAAAEPSISIMRLDDSTKVEDLNRASCSSTEERSLRLVVNDLVLSSYTAQFVTYPTNGPDAPCPTRLDAPFTSDPVVTPEVVATPNGTLDKIFTFKNADLISPHCDEDGGRREITFCVQLTTPSDVVNAKLAGGITIDYDTTLPPKPKISHIASSDTSVTVDVADVDEGGEAYTTVVQYRSCDDGGSADAGSGAGDSECGASGDFSEADADGFTVVVGGLEANSSIELRALFEDDFGNRGAPTALKVVKPQETLGPLDLYDGSDNPMSCEASCADLQGDVASTALLLGLSRRLRRRLRKAVKGLRALAVALLVLCAGTARAELGQTTVGLGLAPYKPAIDTELAKGSRQRIFPIYSCFFDDATLVEIGGDLDTHLFDGFGSLQFGMGFSLAQAQGFAQPSSGAAGCQKPTDVAVQLTMAKLRPGLVYRFDPFLDWISFPLVPYARAALVAAGYAFTKDGDFDQGRVNPLGLRFGWEGALGMMLALDFLDSVDPFVPDTTRRARANGVFDHTFLFVEGAYQEIDTFRQPGLVLTPTDELIGTGWPVLWKIGVAVELL